MTVRLWKRKNGKYYALYEEEGRTRQKSLKTESEKIAKRRLKNFQRDLLAGKIQPPSKSILKVTLGEFREEFLKHKKNRDAEATLVIYNSAFNHAEEALGGSFPLSGIDTRRIEQVIDHMIMVKLAPPTVNKYRRHLKVALNQAYDWGYIAKPVRFPRPLQEKENLRFLSQEDIQKLFDEITDEEFFDFCMFSCYTGLRAGEILRLKWEHVDRPPNFLLVTSEQKNKTDWVIPINSGAREILDRCRKRNNGSRVFRKLTLTWVSQKFKQYAKKAGLNCRLHDLRHTFASHLAMGGKDIRVIQALMRHKSMASTMVYAKLSPGYLAKESNDLDYGPLPFPKKED